MPASTNYSGPATAAKQRKKQKGAVAKAQARQSRAVAYGQAKQRRASK